MHCNETHLTYVLWARDREGVVGNVGRAVTVSAEQGHKVMSGVTTTTITTTTTPGWEHHIGSRFPIIRQQTSVN